MELPVDMTDEDKISDYLLDVIGFCHKGFDLVETEENKMSKQRIAVTSEAAGYIEVEANSIEEAMEKVRKNPNNYPLPYNGGEYVDGSFRLSTDDVDEMKIICNF